MTKLVLLTVSCGGGAVNALPFMYLLCILPNHRNA